MEGTTNYLMIGNNYIVNITQVIIQPYSENLLTDPGKASIVGLDNGALEFTAGTSYNLLQSLELKVTEMIHDNTEITESEKTTLTIEKILIAVQRSNFAMCNMNLYSNYSDVYDENNFIWGLYIQERLISIHDLHVNISGIIFKTLDPLNMNIQNIDVDYYKTLGGIRMDSKWNYPEVTLDNDNSSINENIYSNQQFSNFCFQLGLKVDKLFDLIFSEFCIYQQKLMI